LKKQSTNSNNKTNNKMKTEKEVDLFDLIRNKTYEYYKGVQHDFSGKLLGITVKTTLSGLREINDKIQEAAERSGFVVTASEGEGESFKTKDELLLGDLAYTQYMIPFLGNFKFVVDESKEDIIGQDIEYLFCDDNNENYQYTLKVSK